MQINNISYLYTILSNIQHVCLQHDTCIRCPFHDDTGTGKRPCAMVNELSKAPYRMDIDDVCDLVKHAIERGYDI